MDTGFCVHESFYSAVAVAAAVATTISFLVDGTIHVCCRSQTDQNEPTSEFRLPVIQW